MKKYILTLALLFLYSACSPVAGIAPDDDGGGGTPPPIIDPDGDGTEGGGDTSYLIQTKKLHPKFYAFLDSAGKIDETTTKELLKRLTNKNVGRAVGSIMDGTLAPTPADFAIVTPTPMDAYKANIGKLGDTSNPGKGTMEVLPEDIYTLIFNGIENALTFGNNGNIVHNQANTKPNLRFGYAYKEALTEFIGIMQVNRRPAAWAFEGYGLIQMDSADPHKAFTHVRSFVDNNGVVIPDAVTPSTDEAKWKERIDWLDGVEKSHGKSLLTFGKKHTSEGMDFDYSTYIKVFDPANVEADVTIPKITIYDTGEIALANAKLDKRSTLQFVKVIDNNHAIYQAGTRNVTGGPVVFLGEYLMIEIAGGDLIAHVKTHTANVPTFWATEAEVKKQNLNSRNRGSMISGYTRAI